MDTPTNPITRRRYATLLRAGGCTAYSSPTLHDGPPQRQPSSGPLLPFYRLDKYVFEKDEDQPGDGLVPEEEEEQDDNPLQPGMPDQEESDAPWVIIGGWSFSPAPAVLY